MGGIRERPESVDRKRSSKHIRQYKHSFLSKILGSFKPNLPPLMCQKIENKTLKLSITI